MANIETGVTEMATTKFTGLVLLDANGIVVQDALTYFEAAESTTRDRSDSGVFNKMGTIMRCISDVGFYKTANGLTYVPSFVINNRIVAKEILP